jgi:UDP-2,4-diacetamido-2,4,6-trideoxy-beta-L-altropyranose hydrolase
MPFPSRTICFRTRGGICYGWGHVVRSTRLANHIRLGYPGIRVVMLVEGGDKVIQYVLDQGLPEVLDLRENVELETEAGLIADIYPHTVVFDMLDIPGQLEALYSNKGYRTILFNDMGSHYPYGDIVICPQILDMTDAPQAAPGQIVLTGSDYFVVQEELAQLGWLRQKPPAWPRRLFVNMGGAVRQEIFEYIVAVLNILASEGIESTFLIGFDHNVETSFFTSLSEKGINLIPGTEHLADLLKDADLALAASGYMKYELAAAGVPTVLVAIVDHQEKLGQTFSEISGCAYYAGNVESLDPLVLAKKVLTLAQDAKQRWEMILFGQALVDGQAFARLEGVLLE